MKRQWRNDMSAEQKAKISAANTGRHHSEDTKRRISQSLEKYWAKLPTKPTDGTSGTEPNNPVITNPYKDS